MYINSLNVGGDCQIINQSSRLRIENQSNRLYWGGCISLVKLSIKSPHLRNKKQDYYDSVYIKWDRYYLVHMKWDQLID